MKTYIGKFTKGTARHEVTVRTRGVNTDTVEPLTHHVRHSPDGFNWGYGGSGPSELARCILIDYMLGQRGPLWSGADARELDRLVPPFLYQTFKAEFVQQWPMDQDWVLPEEEVARWLAGKTLVNAR